ncbi:NAD(P)-binding oxidoreductase [Streptomyces sp. NPDC055078]
MKVFIVGIAGGIGSRLARLLTATGDHVDGLYRRPEQGQHLETHGIHATHGDLTRLDVPALAALLHDTDVLVFTAGAGGEGGSTATTAIEAARLAGIRRLLLVSVFPEAWRHRDVSDTFEHYIDIKKQADTELAATDLDWTILRPAALTDDPGTGHISLSPALVHTHITRDDVAATLTELIHTPQIHHQILELTQGPDPINNAIHRQTRN